MNLTVIYPIELQSRNASYIQNGKIIQRFNGDLLHWTIDARGDIFHFMDQYGHDELKVGNIYLDTIQELETRDYEVQQRILVHSNQNLKCVNCSLVDYCPGFAYENLYPEIAFNYKRCVFNEK